MQQHFEGLFPKDNPKNTRFAINCMDFYCYILSVLIVLVLVFTSIGLGGLTDDLREWLRNAPKMIMQQQKAIPKDESDSDSSSSDSDSSSSDSDSSDSDSDSSSSSSSSSSEDDRQRKRQRR